MEKLMIHRVLEMAADHIDVPKVSLQDTSLPQVQTESRLECTVTWNEFAVSAVQRAQDHHILLLPRQLSKSQLEQAVSVGSYPVFVPVRGIEGFVPGLIEATKSGYQFTPVFPLNAIPQKVKKIEELDLLLDESNKVPVLTAFKLQNNDTLDESGSTIKRTPVKRLLDLLALERKDIAYIYVYAILIGLITLVLPVGIQAVVGLISTGVLFSSIYLLMGVVILGVVLTGALQVIQITIVEYLQRRIFTKASFDFTARIPRLKPEALFDRHAPELINRFFDVITIQKGLPKLLIDFSAGIIQIIFGLILLAFYHEFFVFFGLVLLGILYLIFYLTGPAGLKSSITESKYKYMLVHWLEELARSMYAFKLTGTTLLPHRKTDHYVQNYLNYRRTHFSILIKQFVAFLGFKTLITAGLLIIGAVLVVQREISLGQFVASEVVIILMLNAIEKIIMYMDVAYDMLTAVDKIGQVTDVSLENSGNMRIEQDPDHPEGYSLEVKDLSFMYANKKSPALDHLNFRIEKGGRVCISGDTGSGKTTLANIISGIYSDYTGLYSINDINIKQLDIQEWRNTVGKNITQDDLFDGTILENITVGKQMIPMHIIVDTCKSIGLWEFINNLPDGLDTKLVSGGKNLPRMIAQKLILVRCLVKNPRLLILNDFFNGFPRAERTRIIDYLTLKKHFWTFIVVSNDPIVMEYCDQVLWLDKGKIGHYAAPADVLEAADVKSCLQVIKTQHIA